MPCGKTGRSAAAIGFEVGVLGANLDPVHAIRADNKVFSHFLVFFHTIDTLMVGGIY
jgi:hypothetical protein